MIKVDILSLNDMKRKCIALVMMLIRLLLAMVLMIVLAIAEPHSPLEFRSSARGQAASPV